jgi:hypothetical protein
MSKNTLKNFKDEILKILNKNGKTVYDVQWVGFDKPFIYVDSDDTFLDVKVEPFRFDLREFFNLADFVYDCDSGGIQIPQNLKVVGVDWWLERHNYDGCEWWEYKTLPIKPTNINNLFEVLIHKQIEELNN